MKFKIGDKVYAKDVEVEGTIVEIENDIASVEFSTGNGGGCAQFELNELELVPIRIPSMRVFKSDHETLNVVIQNCSVEVATLMTRFNIRDTGGRFEWDKTKPKERPKIWFECPMGFLDFVESDLGKTCFERMGVKELEH